MKTTNEYLTKSANSSNSVPRNMELFLSVIFGSVARGEQHEGSDLDVFVD